MLTYPKPASTQETRPFWEGSAKGVLVLWRCTSCGRIAAPLSPRCPDCLSDQRSAFTASGRVMLKGRTVLSMPAYPGQVTPATLVECAVEEEPRVVLIASDPQNVTEHMAPGAPLRLVFDPAVDGTALARVAEAAP